MRVFDLIAEPMLAHRSLTKKAMSKEIYRLLEVVGLPLDYAGRFPHEFSGGQRQRIGIARALALKPKFIVCDEPVSALDVSIQAQVLNLMQDLQEAFNLTYMFITHDMSVVRHVSDEIMVMYLGAAVEFANSEEMFRQRLHPYTKALLAAVPIPQIRTTRERAPLKGEIASPINIGNGCRFAKRCPEADNFCNSETPLFDEVSRGHFVACHHVKNAFR
jgi:peptide/nickel transport system ATP-binding protein